MQVTGQAQLIEATTSTLGTVTKNKKIVDLPLNTRNIHSLRTPDLRSTEDEGLTRKVS